MRQLCLPFLFEKAKTSFSICVWTSTKTVKTKIYMCTIARVWWVVFLCLFVVQIINGETSLSKAKSSFCIGVWTSTKTVKPKIYVAGKYLKTCEIRWNYGWKDSPRLISSVFLEGVKEGCCVANLIDSSSECTVWIWSNCYFFICLSCSFLKILAMQQIE